MKNNQGFFGNYGGQFVPEEVKKALDELNDFYLNTKDTAEFKQELSELLTDYSGRQTPLYYAESLTHQLGGAKIYLKREDLNHLGTHKLNNVLGQILLAKHMGKTNIIAETGAGQHGVATSAAAAKFGMTCTVFMGEEDMRRQRLNVFRMELLGATVQKVTQGNGTLKEAVDAAFDYFIQHIDDTFYVLGSAVGPHPYPTIVKDFQTIISEEARQQMLEKEGRLPDYVITCVGGGSNTIGAFAEFIPDESVALIGAAAAGKGTHTTEHAATMTKGTVGIIDGMQTYGLFDDDGKISSVYSISAGLDYPGVGPEHAYLSDTNRATYVPQLLIKKQWMLLSLFQKQKALSQPLKVLMLLLKQSS